MVETSFLHFYNGSITKKELPWKRTTLSRRSRPRIVRLLRRSTTRTTRSPISLAARTNPPFPQIFAMPAGGKYQPAIASLSTIIEARMRNWKYWLSWIIPMPFRAHYCDVTDWTLVKASWWQWQDNCFCETTVCTPLSAMQRSVSDS